MEQVEWKYINEPALYRTIVTVSAVVNGSRIMAQGYIHNEALNIPEYLDELKKRLLRNLEIEVGRFMLNMLPTNPEPLGFSVGPIAKPKPKPDNTYRQKAASEFEGVEPLDPALWKDEGGFA